MVRSGGSGTTKGPNLLPQPHALPCPYRTRAIKPWPERSRWAGQEWLPSCMLSRRGRTDCRGSPSLSSGCVWLGGNEGRRGQSSNSDFLLPHLAATTVISRHSQAWGGGGVNKQEAMSVLQPSLTLPHAAAQ